MSFQLREQDTRPYQYPNAQDANFLGFDREADRWKVDASGIHLYASGISVDLDKDNDSVAVWSSSGTPTLPVYIDGSVCADIDIQKDTDSISVWSASGTTDVPVYMTAPIEVQVDLGDSVKISSSSGTPEIPVYSIDPIDVSVINGLVPDAYDDIELGYSGDNLTSVVYNFEGATVAILTLAYSGDTLARVTKT